MFTETQLLTGAGGYAREGRKPVVGQDAKGAITVGSQPFAFGTEVSTSLEGLIKPHRDGVETRSGDQSLHALRDKAAKRLVKSSHLCGFKSQAVIEEKTAQGSGITGAELATLPRGVEKPGLR